MKKGIGTMNIKDFLSCSIRLIGALPSDTMSQIHFHRLLDNVFQALILIVGLEDLIGQRNIEKLKKEIRASFTNFESVSGSLV